LISKVLLHESFLLQLHLSMGITRGEKVKVLKHTLAKNTFDIEVANTNIALREEEAEQIEVEKI